MGLQRTTTVCWWVFRVFCTARMKLWRGFISREIQKIPLRFAYVYTGYITLFWLIPFIEVQPTFLAGGIRLLTTGSQLIFHNRTMLTLSTGPTRPCCPLQFSSAAPWSNLDGRLSLNYQTNQHLTNVFRNIKVHFRPPYLFCIDLWQVEAGAIISC